MKTGRPRRLVQGIGINDADYPTDSNGVQCPFYSRWKDMLARCYSAKAHKTYRDKSVCDQWLKFSNFKVWMETQDWQGNQLDKDLLVQGNKVYSPETCVFVTPQVNSFLSDCRGKRGDYPVGVHFHKGAGRFAAQCRTLGGGKKHLGLFDNPELAHEAWLEFKSNLGEVLAGQQTNADVKIALLSIDYRRF